MADRAHKHGAREVFSGKSWYAQIYWEWGCDRPGVRSGWGGGSCLGVFVCRSFLLGAFWGGFLHCFYLFFDGF